MEHRKDFSEQIRNIYLQNRLGPKQQESFMMVTESNEGLNFEVQDVDPKESKELEEYLTDFKSEYNDDFVRIGSKNCFLTKGYLAEAENIYKFPLRAEDIFVVTFPKSGTTLMQELVWLVCNNVDYETAQLKKLNERFPFLEISTIIPASLNSFTENQMELFTKSIMPLTVNEIKDLPSPRFIKSHLPLSLLPQSLLDSTKVVYVLRDPRDVAVSFYYHQKLTKILKPDKEFKTFWKLFVSDNVIWAPYFEHVKEAWDKRDHPNMLFLFYEEIIKDMQSAIKRVAHFLGKSISDDQLKGLVKHLHIDNFKKNGSVNMEEMQKFGVFTSDGGFIRKGISGGWRKYFDKEMTAEAEEWIAKNLCDTDFRFSHL